MELNMRKEIRQEIKILRKAARKVEFDFKAEDILRLNALKSHQQAVDKINAQLKRLFRDRRRALAKIDRRIAILQGRLS